MGSSIVRNAGVSHHLPIVVDVNRIAVATVEGAKVSHDKVWPRHARSGAVVVGRTGISDAIILHQSYGGDARGVSSTKRRIVARIAQGDSVGLGLGAYFGTGGGCRGRQACRGAGVVGCACVYDALRAYA